MLHSTRILETYGRDLKAPREGTIRPDLWAEEMDHVEQCLMSEGFSFEGVLTGDLADDRDMVLSARDLASLGMLRLPFEHTYLQSTLSMKIGSMSGEVVGPRDVPVGVCAWEIPDGFCAFVWVDYRDGRGWMSKMYSAELTYLADENDFNMQLRVFHEYVSRQSAQYLMTRVAQLVMKLIVYLNSDGIEVEKKEAPEKLNKKRRKHGKPEFKPFHVVKVAPAVVRQAEEAEVAEGAGSGRRHGSPRLHLRRGHKRTLKSGQQTWVRSCVVGIASKGYVQKSYSI